MDRDYIGQFAENRGAPPHGIKRLTAPRKETVIVLRNISLSERKVSVIQRFRLLFKFFIYFASSTEINIFKFS